MSLIQEKECVQVNVPFFIYFAKSLKIIVRACRNVILRLNDRYAVDGNDPNGYVGVMWSITGIHDQVEININPCA